MQIQSVSSDRPHPLDGSINGAFPFTYPDQFIDTNAILFLRTPFQLLQHWSLMLNYGKAIGDPITMSQLRQSSLKSHDLNQDSVFYRCKKEELYEEMGAKSPKKH